MPGPEAVSSFEPILRDLPAGVIVLRGPEHRIEFANEFYYRLVGHRDLVGLTIREALPEIEGQGFFELLDRVYSTGEPYRGSEELVMLDRRGDGSLDEAFVNFVYVPTRGPDREVDGVFAHAVDVTELVRSRRQVEALARELEAERARLATIIEQMPAGVVIGEAPDGRLVLANRSWREFFGVSPEQVGDVGSYEMFAGLDAEGRRYEAGQYPLSRSLRTGEVVVGEEIEFEFAGGGRRSIEINSGPLHDAAGEIAAAVATFFDTTDRRRSERLLATHRSVLELVAAGAPLEHTLDRLVRMIETQSGGTVLASVLLLDGDRLRHGAAPSLPDPYNQAIDGIEIGPSVGSCGTAAYRGERVVVGDIDTDPLWADFRELALEHDLRACWSTPIVSSTGDTLGTFALYYRTPSEPPEEHEELVQLATRTAAVAIERARLEADRAELYERERAARAEAEARAQAAVALAYVADGVCLLDHDGVVRLLNPAAERIFGLRADSTVGRRLVDLVPGFRTVVEAAGGGGDAKSLPVEHGGRELWLAVSAVSFGEGTVYAFRDVTDEHRLEELRADMIATVSHELRTPLAAVYGAAMTLRRADVSDEVVPRLVEIIGQEGERLRGLIDEILLASQLDGPAAVDLVDERFDARRVARAVADGAGDRVELELPDEPVHASADEERVRQVLSNLLDNALKYGAPPVTVRVEANRGLARLSVTDEGPGIPRQQQERIFEKFFRLDPNLLGGVGGTGLGLYIARELVERMGGRIEVESEEGRGAAFVVELPAG